MTAIQPKTKVRLLSFVGPTFENDWSETGVVCRPCRGQTVPNAEWSLVRFDSDGAKLLVHRSRIMIANDQAA